MIPDRVAFVLLARGSVYYGRVGGKSIDRVTTAGVMSVLLPIWTRKHATARQVRQRISAVMQWAIAQGYRNDNAGGADRRLDALPLDRVDRVHVEGAERGRAG